MVADLNMADTGTAESKGVDFLQIQIVFFAFFLNIFACLFANSYFKPLAAQNLDAVLELMQFIYENSEVNSFELLFSSDNFSDFLTRRDHYNDIMNAANMLLKDIEISISDLEANEIELAETQEKYNDYLVELNRAKLEMNKKKKEFETIAAELNLNSGELSEQYKEKNARLVEIKEKIKRQTEKYGWEFIFLAANIDAVETADDLGIRRDRAANYRQTNRGVERSYYAMSEAISSVRMGCAEKMDLAEYLKEDEEND